MISVAAIFSQAFRSPVKNCLRDRRSSKKGKLPQIAIPAPLPFAPIHSAKSRTRHKARFKVTIRPICANSRTVGPGSWQLSPQAS